MIAGNANGQGRPVAMTEPMILVVTGGCGFLGSTLIRTVQQRHPDWKIAICDKCPSVPAGLLRKQDTFQSVDITSSSEVDAFFDSVRPVAVVHAAGVVPPTEQRYNRRHWKIVEAVNVHGTQNVINAAQRVGCKAFVYTSSNAAVTDDLKLRHANIDERWPAVLSGSTYGDSKCLAEAIVLGASGGSGIDNDEMATCAIRPAPMFGEDDSLTIPILYGCIERKETLYKIGSGTNMCDFAYAGNVADAHLLAVENLLNTKTAAGEVFFISNKEPVYFRDFTLAVWKEFGHVPPYEISIPESLAWTMGLIAEYIAWIWKIPMALSRGAVIDVCATRYYDISKAQRILGYEPKVGLEEGIRRSCQAYMKQLDKTAEIKNHVNQ